MLVKRAMEVYPWNQIAGIRLASAFVVMIWLAIPAIKHIPKQKWGYIVISAVCGIFLPAFLFALAQVKLNSSITGVLNALTPFFTFLIGIFFFKQPTQRMQIIGLLIGLIGSIILILTRNKTGAISINGYALFVVLATFLYGINGNIGKTYLQGIKPIYLTSITVSIAGGLGLIYLLSTNWLEIYQTHPRGNTAIWYAIALGVSSTAIAWILFYRLLQLTSAVFSSSITYFIPIVAVILGALDHETLNPIQIIGMAGIVIGILVLNKSNKKT
jgi:drug/metabolite transporter (DMT)-like permease